jgi:hypothetical protein
MKAALLSPTNGTKSTFPRRAEKGFCQENLTEHAANSPFLVKKS